MCIRDSHLTSPRLAETMGTDLFVYHGFTEFRIEGKWLKCTPAFNLELCRRFRVKPLEWDGASEAASPPSRSPTSRRSSARPTRGSTGSAWTPPKKRSRPAPDAPGPGRE